MKGLHRCFCEELGEHKGKNAKVRYIHANLYCVTKCKGFVFYLRVISREVNGNKPEFGNPGAREIMFGLLSRIGTANVKRNKLMSKLHIFLTNPIYTLLLNKKG